MTAQRQWTVGIGVVMALVFGTALVIKIRPQIDLLGVGSTAPTFHATDLRTGRPTTLADFRGKVVLLNVWATWCEPCREEMPTLDRLQARLGGERFQVVALSVDQQGASIARKFYDEFAIKALPLYVDPTAKAAFTLDAPGLP